MKSNKHAAHRMYERWLAIAKLVRRCPAMLGVMTVNTFMLHNSVDGLGGGGSHKKKPMATRLSANLQYSPALVCMLARYLGEA
jgi:hypothetical protein